MPRKGRGAARGKITKRGGRVTVTVTRDHDPSSEEETSQNTEHDTGPHVEEESQSEESRPTASKNSKRFRASLTAQQEQELAEFLQENPVLYDKGKEGWKDTGRKDAMWRQQAEKMEIPIDDIKRWYRDLRTRLSRLLRKKSGQAANANEDKADSDRDRWIIDNLGFLRQHIVQQVQRRPLVSLRAPEQAQTSTHILEEAEGDGGGGEDFDSSQQSDSPTIQFPTLEKTQLPRSSGSRRTHSADRNEIMTATLQSQEQLLNLSQKLLEQLGPRRGNVERSSFCDWVSSVLQEMEPENYRECQKEITSILFRHMGTGAAPQVRLSTSATSYQQPPPVAAAQFGTQWQPHPSQWPRHMPPVSLWGSMESRYMQQSMPQFYQHTASCSTSSAPFEDSCSHNLRHGTSSVDEPLNDDLPFATLLQSPSSQEPQKEKDVTDL